MKTKYFIGDVHGCYETLMALVNQLPDDAELVFLGDLIDRGPDSRKVIEFVRKNNYKCILGNHEELMINHTDTYGIKYGFPLLNSDWFVNGGSETYDNYNLGDEGFNKNQLLDDIKWLKSLPRTLVFKDINVLASHAPCSDFIDTYNTLKETNLKENRLDIKSLELKILWNRKAPRTKGEYFNIFGHNIISNFLSSNYINTNNITEEGVVINKELKYAAIDTGAFLKNKNKYQGKLTCIEMPSMKIFQQENMEK